MTREPMWRRYLRLRGPDVARDVDEEFGFHIETRASEYVAQGLSPGDARRRAVAEFGDMAGARRLCQEIGKEALGKRRWSDLVDSMLRDGRYAFRVLGRSRGFALVAVLTLALGIGATTAIFSVVDGVLLRALPFPEPERLVRIWEVSPRGDAQNTASSGNVTDWRARARAFSALGAHGWPYGVTLTGDGEPAQVMVTQMMPAALEALRASPLLGRGFTAEDARVDSRVVLLSYGFWQRRFGGDRTIIGRQVVLDDEPNTVVGVMPRHFVFPAPATEIWGVVTHATFDPNERRSHNWGVVARLTPAATVEQARTEMRSLAASIAAEHPQFMTGFGTNVVPLLEDMVADVKPMLLVLLGGALLVLLVACANIANLLLARAMTRQREMAIRGAIGAGRARLVRQLLIESLVLAALGGALGVALSAGLVRGLVAFAPADMPRVDEITLDGVALGFAAATTLLSMCVFGIVPALRLARTDLQGALRAAHDRSGGVPHARTRSALLVSEVALSLVLLVGAGLLFRSMQRLRTIDVGYRTEGIVTMSLDLPRARYAGSEAHVEFYRRIVERTAAIPGVVAAAATSEPPASGFNTTFSFAIQGRPSANPSGREDPQPLRVITPDYFRTMQIPLVSGRAFDDRDRADAPLVVMINQSLAKELWPSDNPLGKRISFPGQQGPWREIVGVVGDTRMVNVDARPTPAMYLPHAQKPWPWLSWGSLMVRLAPGQEALSIMAAIRTAVWELDPRLAIHRATTVDELYRDGNARRRFATMLLGGFAVLAVLLGMIGMYGVLSYTVAQQQREIGIRIALGAAEASVMRGIMRQALMLTIGGVIIGSVAALGLTRVLGSLLFEVSPTDPVTYAAVAGLLVAVAALAAWLPARRATRVDPLSVIREA